MMVLIEVDYNDYIGNGVIIFFLYMFCIFKKLDFIVQVVDFNENIMVLILDIDYFVIGVGIYFGGNVVLMLLLVNGWQIFILCDLLVIQEIDFCNQGKFFVEVYEDVFDKLIMFIQ